MATSTRENEKTLLADSDLSAKQYFIVKVTATGCDLAAAATNKIVGVLQNNPTANSGATVRFGGTTLVVAGGTVTVGDWITSDASGKAITTTSAGDFVIGQALQSAVASDQFEIKLIGPFKLS